MKTPVIVLALMFCAAAPSRAADLPPDISYMKNYFACVNAEAKRYAPTKETPSDIADGALAACAALVDNVRSELAKPIDGVTFTRSEVDASLRYMTSSARNAAVRAVLEKRYPKL